MSNKLCLVLSVLLTATMLLAACAPAATFNQRPLHRSTGSANDRSGCNRSTGSTNDRSG